MKRLAVYAGSFDPITNGHLWMIDQGSQIFDKLIVAIGINPNKKYTFTTQERLDMLVKSTEHLKNVSTDVFTNLYLVDYAKKVNAKYILRGIRDSQDFNYERVMRNLNGDFNHQITTVFLVPPRNIAEVSSSMVKGLVGPKGWSKKVKLFVPPIVLGKIKEKHNESKK